MRQLIAVANRPDHSPGLPHGSGAPRSHTITTGAAARLLGVSRPHVVKLINAGLLHDASPTSVYRRLRLHDVLAYHANVMAKHAVLDDMMTEGDASGLSGPRSGSSPRAKRIRNGL